MRFTMAACGRTELFAPFDLSLSLTIYGKTSCDLVLCSYNIA